MNNTRAIISLTSHTSERLKYVPIVLFHSILKYNYDGIKIVLTLYKDDVTNMPNTLKDMIDVGDVELIIADDNLRCHLKYFYAMKKYRDAPIITIDDDSIYPQKMIPDLLENSKKYPNTIIGRSGVIIDKNKSYLNCESINKGVSKISKWSSYSDTILDNLNLEGYGGILYPPNILDINDSLIDEIKQFPRADDIYLYILEKRLNIPRIVPKYNYNKLDMCTKGFDAISTKSDNLKMIDNLIKDYDQ